MGGSLDSFVPAGPPSSSSSSSSSSSPYLAALAPRRLSIRPCGAANRAWASPRPAAAQPAAPSAECLTRPTRLHGDRHAACARAQSGSFSLGGAARGLGVRVRVPARALGTEGRRGRERLSVLGPPHLSWAPAPSQMLFVLASVFVLQAPVCTLAFQAPDVRNALTSWPSVSGGAPLRLQAPAPSATRSPRLRLTAGSGPGTSNVLNALYFPTHSRDSLSTPLLESIFKDG